MSELQARDIERLRRERDEARADLERARGALQPFAVFAEKLAKMKRRGSMHVPGEPFYRLYVDETGEAISLTYDDFDAARAALESSK